MLQSGPEYMRKCYLGCLKAGGRWCEMVRSDGGVDVDVVHRGCSGDDASHHVQALALTLALNALPLQIAVVGTRADFKFHVFDVVFLKSAAGGSSEPDVGAPVTE